jgi:hypothetical protein
MAIRSAVTSHAKIIDIASPAADGPELTAAVNYALASGVIVVAPQGDSKFTAGTPAAPAQVPGVLAVTAVDEQSVVASFAAGAGTATVAAPGKDITAGNLNNHYSTKHNGTGCAGALVAGEAALVLSQNPSWTAGQVIRVIVQTASGHGKKLPNQLGYGVVDVTAAVNAAKPADTSNPLVPSAQAGTSQPAGSSGGSGLLLIVLIAVGALVVIAAAFFLFRLIAKRRRHYIFEPAPYLSAGPMELGESYPQQQYYPSPPQDPNSSGEWALPAALPEAGQPQAEPQPYPQAQEQSLSASGAHGQYPQPEQYQHPYAAQQAYGTEDYQSGDSYPQLPVPPEHQAWQAPPSPAPQDPENPVPHMPENPPQQ